MIDKNTIYAGIFGGVVGDALGVPYEFSYREKMKENPATGMTGYGTYNKPAGTWSDDSSLTLATLDSLTYGVNYDDMIQKFCNWYQHAKNTPADDVFDIGNTTLEALTNYKENYMPPLECGPTGIFSNGNGSLMRIMPAVLYVNARELTTEEQINLISNISALTHGHDISKDSCNIYNFVAQEILNNPDENLQTVMENGIGKSREYYENSEYECFRNIYGNLFDWPEDDLSSKGYVEYSLEVALYCCYHTNSYKDAVLKAVNLGRDTDTNAMITGALAGLYYGFDSIPTEWLNKIIRKEYIEKLCDKFYESL